MPVRTVKDLGVTFDKNLTFNDHIAKTVSSCMSTLGLINRVKHVFKKELLVMIINALVFGKLYYCSSVWSNTTDTNIKKLQCVQNFAARIISNTRKYDHITPVLKSLKWTPVKTNLYFRDAVLAFKCMTGMVPEYVSDKVRTRRSVSGRNTRNSKPLNIPLDKTKTAQRSFSFRIVTIWNNLPTFRESLSIFKSKLRNYLLNEYLSVS